MDFTGLITKKIKAALGERSDQLEISNLIEKPKDLKKGDFAFPTFVLAKKFKKAPFLIAKEISEKIDRSGFEKIVSEGPYVNFFIEKNSFTNNTLQQILTNREFGNNSDGQGKKVVIDMSSPNIAKPMSMGHLRSTVIGEAISKIAQANGYDTFKINFLGDWGTQFGLMIAAYKLWGDDEVIEKDPVNELVKLYVRINKEAENDPKLKESGRAWFKKLEDGDHEATQLWSWFKSVSLKEFQRVYDRLGVSFDSLNGEAFYNDKMQPVVQMLKEKNLLVPSQGAQIVDLPKLLPDENFPIAMIVRSDGATQYITRDLASAIYRYDHYHFSHALYVVGNEQKDHFDQMKAILKLAGDDWSDGIEHIGFGLITMNGKKMSTRKGNVVALSDVLDIAHKLASQQISEKNPDLKDADKVAEEVGVGAVIFNDLKNERNLAIDFDMNKIVQFEGDTGPYVQYTNARANSILRKSNYSLSGFNEDFKFYDQQAWPIIVRLSQYGQAVKRAWEMREPSIIAKYLLNLSRDFNSFYGNTVILVDGPELPSRLALVKATSTILKRGLELLGVKAPSQM
ncbi:arginine--tRNA ligase [Oenococcus alcoholitolerans]|uniref:arginine--tRNA ligase n=1 Tax=Oenococcus alcoholitolerans TaxID=931074 RepID=UPI003F72346E